FVKESPVWSVARDLLIAMYFAGLLVTGGCTEWTRESVLLPWGGGLSLGAGLAALQGHPPRSFGLVLLVATGSLGVFVWIALTGNGPGAISLMGFLLGLLLAPLRAACRFGVAGGVSPRRMMLLLVA